MSKLTEGNISFIKEQYFKLGVDVRRKITIVSESLSDGDEETLHSLVWYFSKKENRKELDSVFKDVANNNIDFQNVDEKEGKKPGVPSKIKIVKDKK
jgi:hypothetical protein